MFILKGNSNSTIQNVHFKNIFAFPEAHFNNFPEGLKIFWRGRGVPDGKGVINLLRGGRGLAFDKFYFMALVWLTISMQTERCCITCCFALTILAYFILSRFFKCFTLLIAIQEKKCIEVNTSEYQNT